MALQTTDELRGVYLRVESPRIHGKFTVSFFVVQYVTHPIEEVPVEIGREEHHCPYSLDGPNVFEQCYTHLKTVLPYSTLDC